MTQLLGGSVVVDEAVRELSARMLAAKHGTKDGLVNEVAERIGRSPATIRRLVRDCLRGVKVVDAQGREKARKPRADKGASALTEDDAVLLSAYLMSTHRANGKRLADIETALATLHANGEINAGRVDKATGEWRRISAGAASVRLRQLRLHPDQLTRPAPKVSLASAHPNHVWQIDPSLCVLYYLHGNTGLQVMEEKEFYKNKPKNLERIAKERVWRYVVVDHTTGALYVEYVLGAESGRNLCTCFINAMQPRGTHDPFHGVPRMVMVDPGSANMGAMFKNLCAALGTVVWVNQPHHPWAKGSVEKHNDIVERKFEQGLAFIAVHDLDELNAAAWRWMRHFNATARHSRHGMTRYAAWMRITIEQLVLAPAAAVCRRLASSAPETRVVNTLLQVSYRGRKYDVSGVPGVIVGDTLTVARNAWADADTAHVLGTDETGQAAHFVVPALEQGEYGFAGAVQIGQFRQHADTPADTNRKRVERAAMDAATDEEAAAQRKAKALPLGGRIDPFLPHAQLREVAHLPRAATPSQVTAPAAIDAPRMAMPENPPREFPPLNHVDAARAVKPLVERAGGTWSAELYQRTVARWPEGLPLAQVEAWAAELAQATRLRVVGGVA